MNKINELLQKIDETEHNDAVICMHMDSESREAAITMSGKMNDLIDTMFNIMMETPELVDVVNGACFAYMTEMTTIAEEAEKGGIN